MSIKNFNWWKNPVLQGEENDYGDYDYLINDIPESSYKWEWSKYKWRDDHGHESHLRKVGHYYFMTMDGYDSMDESECWRCIFKGFIKRNKRKIKFWFKSILNNIKEVNI